MPAAGPPSVTLPFDPWRPTAKRTAWQIRISDDPVPGCGVPGPGPTADGLLVEAVERAWLGVTEIEVMYDRHAHPVEFATHTAERARQKSPTSAERTAGRRVRCISGGPAVEPAWLILLDGLLRTYLSSR